MKNRTITVLGDYILFNKFGNGKDKGYDYASESSYFRIANVINGRLNNGIGYVRPFIAGQHGYVYEERER